MESNIYSFVAPIAIGLLALEIIYCYILKNNFITFADAITNLGTAIGNQLVNVLVAIIIYWSFGWISENFAITKIEMNLLNFVILLILFDFLFYWFHRFGHTINILWAAHMPHHTSEEFNLFVGLRASITQRLFSFTFMWPLAIIGFSAKDIYAASAIQLLLGFWHHTKVIGKMPGFETIFNSPSYHRVHHAINDKYLDKNFGEIFIIWDKIFGTCAKETDEVIYGALTPIQSWNPNKIYFHYWKILLNDAINTKSWFDKVRLWFMPLGWRPEDVRHIPRGIINEKTLVKFETPILANLKPYLVLQSAFALFLMFIIITPKFGFHASARVTLSIFLWLMITSWGGLLEGKSWARILEPLNIFCMTVFLFFQLQNINLFQNIGSLLFAYGSLSILWAVFMLGRDKKSKFLWQS